MSPEADILSYARIQIPYKLKTRFTMIFNFNESSNDP